MHIHEVLTTSQGVVVDYSFDDPVDNLCYDDVLLQMAESQKFPCALRFWESTTPFIVLGRSGSVEDDLYAAAVLHDGVRVYRRSSGGGTVVQGPGCMNYALVVPKQKAWTDVRASYAAISGWLLDALEEVGVRGEYEPVSDLAVNGFKFSGNAQRRGRTHILQHGTILYNFNLACITKWLAQPQVEPPYRAGRPHAEFVVNIAVNPAKLKTSLARCFPVPHDHDPLPDSLAALEQQRSWGRVQALTL